MPYGYPGQRPHPRFVATQPTESNASSPYKKVHDIFNDLGGNMIYFPQPCIISTYVSLLQEKHVNVKICDL